MRFLPLATLALFFLASFAGRSVLHRLRHGSWGIALFQRGGRFTDALFIVVPGALLLQAALHAAGRDPLALLWPASAAGALVALAGLAPILAAQLQMGASW